MSSKLCFEGSERGDSYLRTSLPWFDAPQCQAEAGLLHGDVCRQVPLLFSKSSHGTCAQLNLPRGAGQPHAIPDL